MSSATHSHAGIVHSNPLALLRLEGVALLAGTLYFYQRQRLPWAWLAAGLFVPDLAMAGYARSPALGAWVYNLAHTETGALAALGVGVAGGHRGWLAVGLVWLAHIGMDRMIGAGLKYDDGFGVTHLGLWK